MFKFNDNNIFTGYIKQLLATFNLPKYKVYTKEQQEYVTNYKLKDAARKDLETELAELEAAIESNSLNLIEKREANERIVEIRGLLIPELNVLASSYRNDNSKYIEEVQPNNYQVYMRYIPYIKDNIIQIYAPKVVNNKVVYSDNDWKQCHFDLGSEHWATHKKDNIFVPQTYTYNLKIKNYTKNLVIQNNIYDSYTHEYLGDYLRFQRDYNHINLMSLYNCFSNRVCPNLDVSIVISPRITRKETYTDPQTGVDKERTIVIQRGYTAEFKTADQNYKIYMVPIKLFKKYTIAIDCSEAVEMCCGLYNKYPYETKYNSLMEDTYICYNSLQFNNPVLFDKTTILNKYTGLLDSLELAQHEDDLKLFIKLPFNNKSSIVILEGDYTNYTNPMLYKFKTPGWDIGIADTNSSAMSDTDLKTTTLTNHTVINYEGDITALSDKLVTPLQLFKLNTGISYPFADRLLEYLVGNVVTHTDAIGDNIERAKKIAAANSQTQKFRLITGGLYSNDLSLLWRDKTAYKTAKEAEQAELAKLKASNYNIEVNGIWTPELQVIYYDFINKKYNTPEYNHDILGYVDKDVEKLYSCRSINIEYKNGTAVKNTTAETISNANIYGKDEWED